MDGSIPMKGRRPLIPPDSTAGILQGLLAEAVNSHGNNLRTMLAAMGKVYERKYCADRFIPRTAVRTARTFEKLMAGLGERLDFDIERLDAREKIEPEADLGVQVYVLAKRRGLTTTKLAGKMKLHPVALALIFPRKARTTTESQNLPSMWLLARFFRAGGYRLVLSYKELEDKTGDGWTEEAPKALPEPYPATWPDLLFEVAGLQETLKALQVQDTPDTALERTTREIAAGIRGWRSPLRQVIKQLLARAEPLYHPAQRADVAALTSLAWWLSQLRKEERRPAKQKRAKKKKGGNKPKTDIEVEKTDGSPVIAAEE
jgi:hypothetical protein